MDSKAPESRAAARSDVEQQGAASGGEDGRPDFAAFVLALRQEAEWQLEIHELDKTGQGRSDVRALRELAAQVEAVGKSLGYL